MTIWYDPEFDILFLREVVHHGEFASFIQREYDPEFAPAMEDGGFVYIGEL